MLLEQVGFGNSDLAIKLGLKKHYLFGNWISAENVPDLKSQSVIELV